MSSPLGPLRQLFENHLSQLSTDVEQLVAEARANERRQLADSLNQAVRRICQSTNADELAAGVIDAAGSLAAGAALFEIADGKAAGRRIRGVPDNAAVTFRSLELPLVSAAALASAVESRDPVTAVTSAAEVSPEMMALAGHSLDGRVSIFPVIVSDGVAALVYAWGTTEGAAIELLAQVAGAAWSQWPQPTPVEQLEPAPVDLVQIATAPSPALPAPPAKMAASWEQLSTEEQRTHFQAQRFARVQVAEMMLYRPDAVQSGRGRRRLYEALRGPIDAGREKFRQTYFAGCPSMVDYLHLELVRTLANDDAEQLGTEYPGPLF
jgi:hypothetical protein